jgi:membrane associated rhomboid family serine protease
MNYTIVLVNVFVFFNIPPLQTVSEDFIFLWKYGSTPYLVTRLMGSGALSSITSTFLHGNLLHLFGNMFALLVFGRRVEDACGPWRYLCFYLLCSTSADIISTVVRLNSLIPSIGASGAIFGVMGAYWALYPEGRIRTLIFIWFVPTWPRIRAFWVILYFLGLQVIPALSVLAGNNSYQVNYWAHLGGFAGAIFVLLFLRPEAYARYVSDTSV